MDDDDAWKKYPQHRWIFNKLEVAMKLGYDCGPACIPVTKSDNYIIRPIYNLYGMGVGANLYYIDVSEKDFMWNHGIIPPGHFWCEAFGGNHISIDYKRTKSPPGSIFCWEPYCTIMGEQNKYSLTKFDLWVKVNNMDLLVPSFCNFLDGVTDLNIEFIDDKPIEIHLRTGNDIFHDKPIGYTLYPVWESDGVEPDFPNKHPERYDASGYLSDIRVGYSLTKPSK